jgi:8-oxo-dGTP diphosphatase
MGLFDPAALPDDAAASIRPVIAEFAASPAYGRVRPRYDVLTSTGLLTDEEGRFLLQHRDDKAGIANPGKWGSFGGAVEPGETPDEGFVREIEEELAWRPQRFELLRAYPFAAGRLSQLIYVYVAQVDVPYGRLVLGEGQGMGYFAPDALPEDTVPELRSLIEWYAGRLGRG